MQWLLKNFGKKLSATLTGVVIAVCNNIFGWGIDPEVIGKVIDAIMVYVGGQAVADGLSGGKTSSLEGAK